MELLTIYEKPCKNFLESIGDCGKWAEYLGFSIQNGKVIHYIKRGDGLVKIYCSSCILSELLKNTALVKMPEIRDGFIVFTVVANNAVKKYVRRRRVKAVVKRWRNPRLTPRQRAALIFFSNGGLEAVAQGLGISKSAACKLVKRALKKVVEILS